MHEVPQWTYQGVHPKTCGTVMVGCITHVQYQGSFTLYYASRYTSMHAYTRNIV